MKHTISYTEKNPQYHYYFYCMLLASINLNSEHCLSLKCAENSPADTEVASLVSPEIADMFNETENNEDQKSPETDITPPPAEQ